MIKKLSLISIIALTVVVSQWTMVNAQSISRKVISSAGGTMTAGGNTLTFNIGEPAVHTLTAGGSMITQGFEQPGEQIITGVVSPLSYCAGNIVSVPFSAIDIGGGNTFTAQLSNASGSFAVPVNIGTLAGNASGSINATIPPLTPAGAGYRIRVVSNAPGKTGSDNGINIAISSGAPTGSSANLNAPADACSGTTGQLITVSSISGANVSYSWNTGTNSSVVLFSNNAGGPYVAGPFSTSTNQVYVQFGALASGSSGYNICVQGVNACGSTNNKCIWVRGKVSVPGAITPPANAVACPNDVKNYSCGSSAGATDYNWTLAGSPVPVTSGQGTQNVQVTFPVAFTSGQLCVTAALTCGGSSTSSARCMTVTKNPAVPAPFAAGPNKVCPGATGVIFSVPAVTGASGYNWTVPAGCTITNNTPLNTITVDFPNPYIGAPPVCVSAISACGSSIARCKTVGSNIPGQPGAITGATANVCNSTVQYSIANVAGANDYTWTNPAGTTITSGQTSSTILLAVSPTFVSGQLTVTANTNLCTPGTSTPRTITITGKPSIPGTITQNPPGLFCAGAFLNFSVAIPVVGPLPVYSWVVTNGTITAGQGSNNIDITWGSGAGNVNVIASNGCGTSGTRSQSFSSGCREDGSVIYTSSDFSVYPNPAHDYLTVGVNVKETTGLNMQLLDMSGRVVLSQSETGTSGFNTYGLSLKHLAKGIYMLEVKSAHDYWMEKVVVE